MELLIINGPNLNLLGKREPEIYGNRSFDEYLEELRLTFPNHRLHYFQSNHEGELIDKIQTAGYQLDGILLNAGGYTHTSVAIADAIAAVTSPVVEVHISNPNSREAFRRHSYLSPYCKAVISGFGLESYKLAIIGLLHLLGEQR